MSGPKVKATDWKQRLVQALGRDKKKTAVLAALAAVAIVLVGRLVIPRSAPSRAGAAIASAVCEPAPGTSAGAKGGAAAAAPSDKRAIVRAGRTIKRDIFVPDADFYPPEEAKDKSAVVVTAPSTQPDAQAEMEAVRNQARSLALQSTIVSDAPTAIVNNHVLRLGDGFNGFQVVGIGSTSCTLEKSGVRVVLEMKKQ